MTRLADAAHVMWLRSDPCGRLLFCGAMLAATLLGLHIVARIMG